MKKIISFILVLAMILGTASVTFAQPSFTVTTDNTVVPFKDAETNAVTTILRDIGALEGDENGNVNVTKNITRAEAVTVIVRALGLNDQGKVKVTTKFTDVKKEAWYSGYIAVAAANGYVDGVGDNKFNPEANISMDEVITMLLKVLGYDMNLEGVWPSNYRDLALAKNILTNVEVGSQAATRGDMFQVLYNILSLTKAEQTLVKFDEKTKTFGSYVNSLTLFQKLTRNGNYATLGELYTIDNNAAVITKDTKLANGFDVTKYNGMKATFVKKAGQVIGLASVAGIVLEGQFFTGTVTTFKAIDGTIYTVAPNALTTSVTRTGNAGVYGGTVLTEAKQDYKICVELDGKRITKIYSEEYWTNPTTLVVTASEAAVLATGDYASIHAFGLKNSGICSLAFETTKAALDSNVDVFANTFEVTGAATKLADIKADDVVEVYIAEGFSNNFVRKIVVTRNKVVGPVTKYSPLAKTIKVNGVDYKFTANAETLYFGSLANVVAPSTSDRALLLNSNGKVVYVTIPGIVTAQSTFTTKYGFIRATGYTPAVASTALDAELKVTVASVAIVIGGVEKIYSFTPAAMTSIVDPTLVATSTDVFATDTNGKFVQVVSNAKDEVVSLKAITEFGNDEDTMIKAHASGMEYISGGAHKAAAYASDVVIVELQDNVVPAKYITQVAYYKVIDKEDIIFITITGANIIFNEEGRIQFVFFNRSEKSVQVNDNTVITLAAFTGKFEALNSKLQAQYFANFMINGNEVTMEVTKAAYTALINKAYKLVCDDDMVIAVDAYEFNDGEGVFSASSIKINDGCLIMVQPQIDGIVGSTAVSVAAINTTLVLDASVLMYKFTADNKVKVVNSVDDETNVLALDLDDNGFYDALLVDYLSTEIVDYID